MKISEHFQLNKSQIELDFIDIDTTYDTPLFLDPFLLSKRTDRWSIEATNSIKSFFQKVLNLIKENKSEEAKVLFNHFEEPNATCLGVSSGKPQGRGVGKSFSKEIFDNILKSTASKSGLIEDLQDNILFIDGFGKDMLSDMTTNLIKKQLLEYTKNQCILHEIPLTNNIASGFYWNNSTLEWDQRYTEQLLIDGERILLVPKGIVSYSVQYTSETYYNHFVLNFMQGEEIRLRSALVQHRKNGTPFVTKKSIKEIHPLTKDFLVDFTKRNPKILENFKNRLLVSPLTNQEISDIEIPELIKHLVSSLKQIKKGNNDASNYHRLIKGILELIFYPHLINPKLEKEIHNGRKRIDITFDNGASDGIFLRMHQNMNLPCSYIMIECKNYSPDPTNPELDQLAGRFSINRGKVGFLLCRNFKNFDLFLDRCKDTFNDQRGLIIPLVDDDLIKILENYNDTSNRYIEDFLSQRVRLITMS